MRLFDLRWLAGCLEAGLQHDAVLTRRHNTHDCYYMKPVPVHCWLQLLSCGPREHEKVAAALQDDRRQSVKTVKTLEEELAAMQAAALVRDVPPGQQELPAQHVSSLQQC